MIDPTTPMTSDVLDVIGGEPLTGSGFEGEHADDSFDVSEAFNGYE
jgi:hypothetical protein